MTHPYSSLPSKAFWRTAVADRKMLEIDELWSPKFEIDQASKIATFGSCFAQHFGKALRENDFTWMDAEPAPTPLTLPNVALFNYRQFSCRTANIYTTSLLNQWVSWALGDRQPPDDYWEHDGRIFDPFRPRIEPNGFESIEEMRRSRQVTIDSMAEIIKTADIFVFTMGLTESWFDTEGDFEYPMCPGTIAGDFNKTRHKFVAQDFRFIEENLREVVEKLRAVNPSLKMLLTVSPVPLTATNSDDHVLVASSASKAILRAVAETMKNEFEFIDYFPSYEIINSPVFKGWFFKPNLRQVEPRGVNFVMKSFFAGIGFLVSGPAAKQAKAKTEIAKQDVKQKLEDIACEEEVLAAFASIKED